MVVGLELFGLSSHNSDPRGGASFSLFTYVAFLFCGLSAASAWSPGSLALWVPTVALAHRPFALLAACSGLVAWMGLCAFG